MGHVQKITHNEQAHPETQQAVAQQSVAETLKRGQSQVEKTQKSGKGRIEPDGGGKSGNQAAAEQQERQETASGEQSPEQEQKKSPWTGNIVNVKV